MATITTRNAYKAIAKRQEFTAGAMEARIITSLAEFEAAVPRWKENAIGQRVHAEFGEWSQPSTVYVITSYGWLCGAEIPRGDFGSDYFLNEEKNSATTNRHVSQVRMGFPTVKTAAVGV